VLDCGDAGHILLSKHVADDLGEYRHWQPYLRDLGECEVKHGLRLHLVNLCKNDLGNPQVPEKLRRRKRWKETGPVHPVASPRWPRWVLVAALLLSGCALAISFTIFLRHRTIRSETFDNFTGAIPDKSIAVLPFQNLSDDKQNAYFADGVQDEILTNLAKVADLKVISRTSVMQYKNSAERNLRAVGKALGVAHILEGTVQRAGGRVRVSAQLIDARTDGHLWAESYDRELADVFAIENELAEQIVAQLKSKLSLQEKAAIERKPTADLAAYDLYTRAKILIERAVFNEPREASLLEAVKLLEQASSRDPSFALAYYELAHAHDQLYWGQYDHTPQRLALADAAIQTLRRLQPDSGEAHLALAKHLYWGYLDYDRARQELAAAEGALPNDSDCLLLLGYIDRRQGRWEASLKEMERAQTLDPRNILILKQIGLTHRQLRRYSDVIAVLDRALQLDPNDLTARSYRARVDLEQYANAKPLHMHVETFLAQNPKAPQQISYDLVDLALFERDPAMAERTLSGLSYSYGAESVAFPRAWCDGRLALLRGDAAAAKVAFTEARKPLERTVREQPNNAAALIALGMVDAALGQKKDAIREGRRAIELSPVSKDAIDGALFMEYLAAIYTMSGEIENAVNQLKATAKLPGDLNYGELQLDPIWDPLRRDPRFDKIVASLAPK